MEKLIERHHQELTDMIGRWLIEANAGEPGYCIELHHLNYVANRAFELGVMKGQDLVCRAMIQSEDSEI